MRCRGGSRVREPPLLTWLRCVCKVARAQRMAEAVALPRLGLDSPSRKEYGREKVVPWGADVDEREQRWTRNEREVIHATRTI